jgi:hypothetical protein
MGQEQKNGGLAAQPTLCQTEIQFHTEENFPEQLNFLHMATSQAETFLAGLSKHNKVPKLILN